MPAGPVWQAAHRLVCSPWRCGLVVDGDFSGIGQDWMCSLQRIKTRGGSAAGA